MRAQARTMIKRAINGMVAPLGIKVVRQHDHDWSDTRNFIPIDDTLAEAKRRGMSVGDYIDEVMNNIPGATQSTISELQKLGVFAKPIATALEIGPGSGRYLEKIVSLCAPKRYEIYETSKAWADFLVRTYDVVHLPTDGRTLSGTETASCDLVQAYKVFSSIPFLPSIKYWAEMVRVTRPGGFVIFDIMTEACLDVPTAERWIASSVDNGAYPASIPSSVAKAFFAHRDCTFVGSFLTPMGEGHTETFAFQRK